MAARKFDRWRGGRDASAPEQVHNTIIYGGYCNPARFMEHEKLTEPSNLTIDVYTPEEGDLAIACDTKGDIFGGDTGSFEFESFETKSVGRNNMTMQERCVPCVTPRLRAGANFSKTVKSDAYKEKFTVLGIFMKSTAFPNQQKLDNYLEPYLVSGICSINNSDETFYPGDLVYVRVKLGTGGYAEGKTVEYRSLYRDYNNFDKRGRVAKSDLELTRTKTNCCLGKALRFTKPFEKLEIELCIIHTEQGRTSNFTATEYPPAPAAGADGFVGEGSTVTMTTKSGSASGLLAPPAPPVADPVEVKTAKEKITIAEAAIAAFKTKADDANSETDPSKKSVKETEAKTAADAAVDAINKAIEALKDAKTKRHTVPELGAFSTLVENTKAVYGLTGVAPWDGTSSHTGAVYPTRSRLGKRPTGGVESFTRVTRSSKRFTGSPPRASSSASDSFEFISEDEDLDSDDGEKGTAAAEETKPDYEEDEDEEEPLLDDDENKEKPLLDDDELAKLM